MVDRVGGRTAAPTDRTLTGVDWYGQDITGVEHERVLFQNLDANECTGTGARFVDCTFRSAEFAGAELTGVAFENCTFVHCNFFNSRLTGCKLVGSLFGNCAFDQMRVVGGDWSFTGLPGADLRRAHLAEVRMREADLTGARCTGAVIRNCDLSGGMWSRADVSRCDLRGSDLSTLDPYGVELAGAIIDWSQAIMIARNLGLDVRTDSD